MNFTKFSKYSNWKWFISAIILLYGGIAEGVYYGKKYTNYNKKDMSSFHILKNLKDIKVGKGGIICI